MSVSQFKVYTSALKNATDDARQTEPKAPKKEFGLTRRNSGVLFVSAGQASARGKKVNMEGLVTKRTIFRSVFAYSPKDGQGSTPLTELISLSANNRSGPIN
jgi:hypothetical protein